MLKLDNHMLDIDGVPTHIARGGNGPRTIIFLHGGIPGVTPYVGGAYLWDSVLARFAKNAEVVAIDLLGSGGTGYPFDRPLTIDDINAHAAATIAALDLPPAHVIGHDIGALTALWLGMQGSDRIASVGVVASATSSPSGEAWEDLTLASPPAPLLGRDSQRWVFDRLSATIAHIDDALLDAAIGAGQQPGVRKAFDQMASDAARATFHGSHARVRGALWARAREGGYPLPVQIIWGAQDPLTTVAMGHILFATLSAKQRMTQFHLLNEAGSFVFREQPAQFTRITNAFLDGLDMIATNTNAA